MVGKSKGLLYADKRNREFDRKTMKDGENPRNARGSGK
jgi:hypothetical protein